MFQLLHGDCIEIMRTMPDNSVDAVVTDPPYGINFMGKAWDNADILAKAVPGKDHTKTRERSASMHAGEYDLSLKGNQAFEEWTRLWAVEAFRVLKPGGHLLCFSSSRTYHRMAAGVEDAGFEIRDQIMWLYGSGFPKSLNLKDEWQGWGTALKPAHEPIVVARKPLVGTVAANVQTYGTGALNIDGCRVGYASDNDKDKALAGDAFKRKDTSDAGWSRPWMADEERVARMNAEAKERAQAGRWPANVIHDGSDEVLAGFPTTAAGNRPNNRNRGFWADKPPQALDGERLEGGSAARFFYCAKASKRDRNEGAEHNHHPTVKPTDLMRYLVRLVTPPNGTVLDPFTGSGSTGKACMFEGFQFIGIEQDADYIEIARARIQWAWDQMVEAAVNPQPDLFDDLADDVEASA